MSDSHTYCRLLLQQAKKDCSSVPKGLHAWKAAFGQYEVRDRAGNLLWTGKACCKWHARAEALIHLIEKEGTE